MLKADPNILETVVVTEENEIIQLKWIETEPILANKHLPVWTVPNDRTYLVREKTMEEVGRFSAYHDIEQSSAVLLIHRWNCIYGIIDVRYQIVCLPLDQLSNHQIIGESQYVMILGVHEFVNHIGFENISPWRLNHNLRECGINLSNHTMLIKTLINPNEFSSYTQLISHCRSLQIDPAPLISNLRGYSNAQEIMTRLKYEDRKIVVYPEVLIIISHEIARLTTDLTTLLLRYLVQFNAVAMLFAKLREYNIEIHINIAGIIIDKDTDVLLSAAFSQSGLPSGKLILDKMSDYICSVKSSLDYRKKVFTEDAVDMFILSTTREWAERSANPGGIATSAYHMMSYRFPGRNRPKTKFLGAIVDGTEVLQHYVNAAREIAHLMTVEDDPVQSPACCNGKQCYGIMQIGGQHCPKCLTWSPQSVKSFKQFLSTHTNRCFLRNRPRSLYPYESHIQTLYPADQCLCYGFLPSLDIVDVYRNRTKTICRLALDCLHSFDHVRVRSTPIPVEGTPCLELPFNTTKVCWRKSCVPTV